MRSKTIKVLITLSCCLPIAVQAQDAAPSWLEESLHAAGKMNTVIAVVAIILVGIGIWLFAQERKLAKLEKAILNNERGRS